MVTVIELADEFELRDLKGYSVPRIGWCKSSAMRKAFLHGREASTLETWNQHLRGLVSGKAGDIIPIRQYR